MPLASILEGTSRLRWFFRQEAGHGNGWIAFGDKDTQEYVDNPDNMAVVDFNVLANIEPAVVNVFYLPAGTDLEFRSDGTGAYFINTQTGEEIRERAKNPLQEAFDRNLKFLNQETYPEELFRPFPWPASCRKNHLSLDVPSRIDLLTTVPPAPLIYSFISDFLPVLHNKVCLCIYLTLICQKVQ